MHSKLYSQYLGEMHSPLEPVIEVSLPPSSSQHLAGNIETPFIREHGKLVAVINSSLSHLGLDHVLVAREGRGDGLGLKMSTVNSKDPSSVTSCGFEAILNFWMVTP